jgi:hypothetical protein
MRNRKNFRVIVRYIDGVPFYTFIPLTPNL